MNYYNEHDPKAAAWLRELIKGGHIPAGEVDERSIVDVRATELSRFTQCHFFAGIGGWSLALRLAGWPDDEPVWTGSCPCQPFSAAGKRMGNADSRHLWPAFRRLICHGAPPVVFGEQVASADGRKWLAGVRANLEAMGYAVGSADLCAAGLGAPHIRQRLWWVADAADGGRAEHGSKSGQRRITGPEHTAECGGSGGLEHPSLDGRKQRRAQSGGGILAGGCGLGGLEQPNSDGPASGQFTTTPNGHGCPVIADGSNGRLADVLQPGLERHAGHGHDWHQPGRIGTDATGSIATSGRAGFWSHYDLIPCADGKARRIEPGTFPLANGVSGRVGLLRGYGNAIVPEVAAEFIQAYLEARLS